MLTERVAFRPLRDAAPATTLVATFAVAFALEAVWRIAFGVDGRSADVLGGLNKTAVRGALDVRWITIVELVAGAGAARPRSRLLLGRTNIGLQMRAAAADIRTARALGVRADRVITFAFVLAGLLAGVVAMLLTASAPLVEPRSACTITIFALVGVVVGGMDNLVSATLGGFALGLANSLLGDILPADQRVFLPSFTFLLVIIVARAATGGAVPLALGGRRGARVSSRNAVAAMQLAGPVVLLLIVGLVGSTVSEARQQDFITALVQATIVIAIYVFVGNSGVLSFGHISFVAIGAFAAGIMTIPALVKPTLLPELCPFIADHAVSNIVSLLLAVGLGAVFALLVGAPLMRLAGLAAGIATFAVLEITHNVLRFWEKIGPGAKTLSWCPPRPT